ncbi:MAG TPA: hypothetical protein VG826_13115 [Pirellulales bacterium]|nr:hypothetical protein [Pirellulales bacterium]
MLKAADALDLAGYDVRVVSSLSAGWATQADDDARRRRTWRWAAVDSRRHAAPRTYFISGLRFHGARRLARLFGTGRLPLSLAARGYARLHDELVAAIVSEPCDLIYAGQTGALAAAAVAGRRMGVPYALDLEDFHSAEAADEPANRLAMDLAARIEREILPGAEFLTAGSAAIANAYEGTYGRRPIPINNAFPLPPRAPDIRVSPGAGLKLYWFSQTIGTGRGLEDVVRAMGLARLPGELHLRGSSNAAYADALRQLARAEAPRLELVIHAPGPPDSMVDACRDYDLGLALEQDRVFNRTICLTNKAFTYMLAGLALVFTDTPGQRPLIDDLGAHALVYRPGDIATLAAGLKSWADDPPRLLQAKQAAWAAAERRWHWEHPQERGALLDAVASALTRAEPSPQGDAR